ncbi:amidohydrolase family protein [Herbihabitans rhizosphaerae]|uniref:Amidohydrolase family protein n=1 Tax=Herbihabitans rhizosphaerae TaxID=1872711 RepID=A0A4Q7KHM2_9PSEU|nr:amidohydrolase family protein [Herbihabitans rhizosphaerae]RZS34044.1 amidohydrolase family protein [Herbihabitans rhizosphaerae]
MSMPGLDRPTLDALAAAGRAHGLTVVAHAVDAGVLVLQHVPTDPLPDDLIAEIAARGVAVTPTLAPIENVCGEPGGAALLDDPDLEPLLGGPWREFLSYSPGGWAGEPPDFGVVLANVAKLAAVGVTVLAGTDAPNPGTVHGASLHRDLELLVRAGLSPADALRSATSVPAVRYGLADRSTVHSGQRADLLLVDGDPTTDIARTRAISRIWRGGVEHDRTVFLGGPAERELTDSLHAQFRRVLDRMMEHLPPGVDLGSLRP